ncbi:hypothetical protein, partial [Rhizobium sp. rho-13.1]|uniref:hypothetical protein n=1 Tax=Rhizobium sp. rho-13.1 TaxID=2506431 RepID=UPI00193D8D85
LSIFGDGSESVLKLVHRAIEVLPQPVEMGNKRGLNAVRHVAAGKLAQNLQPWASPQAKYRNARIISGRLVNHVGLETIA